MIVGSQDQSISCPSQEQATAKTSHQNRHRTRVKAAQVFNNIRVVKIILLDRIESFGAGPPGLVRRNIWNHDRPPGVSHELDNKVVVCTIRSPRICGAERDSLYRARAGTDGTSRDRGRAVCELGGANVTRALLVHPGCSKY
jgi:hypothetical protein